MTVTREATAAAVASPRSTATERPDGAGRGSADRANARARCAHGLICPPSPPFTLPLSPGGAHRPSVLRGNRLRTKDDERPVSAPRRTQIAHRGRRAPRPRAPTVPAWTH